MSNKDTKVNRKKAGVRKQRYRDTVYVVPKGKRACPDHGGTGIVGDCVFCYPMRDKINWINA